MAVTAILSNHYKYQLAKKLIDLSADDIRVCLVRNGYSFNPDKVAKKINMRTNSGAISITFSTSKTISRGTGSWLTDGFIPGNKITTDASLNPGPFTITNVTQYVITVNETMVDEGPVVKTVSSDDEIGTNYGYTQYAKALVSLVLTEDNTNDRAEMTCADPSWTASGGTIGPSPGALLIDESTSDKTVIGFLDFGGNQSATTGQVFTLEDVVVRVS